MMMMSSRQTGLRRECVSFIGTHISNLYTEVDTPARAACYASCSCFPFLLLLLSFHFLLIFFPRLLLLFLILLLLLLLLLIRG